MHKYIKFWKTFPFLGIKAISPYSVPDSCLILFCRVSCIEAREGRLGWSGWGRTEVDALWVEAASVNTEVLTPSAHPPPLPTSPLSPDVYTGPGLQHATSRERHHCWAQRQKSLYSPPLITWKTINKAPQ